MYLLKQKQLLKNLVFAFGVVLWVGILGPEIFIKSGTGCMLDENGEELTPEEARDFMEKYFYGGANEDSEGETGVNIKYRIALLEYLGG